MQRDTPWRLLLGSQIFVVSAVAALQWGLAPELMRRYADAGAELGLVTELALTTPAPIVVAGLSLVVALASLGLKRGPRLRLMSGALIVSGAVLTGAFLAAVWPLAP